MVLRDDGFRFVQRRKSPLNFQIFISRNTLNDPALFDEQLELTRLVGLSRVPFSRVAKSMRPVGTQSLFTTPCDGAVFQLFQFSI